MMDARRFLLALVAVLCIGSPARGADDTLARAKDLYQNAEYDEALAVLDRVTGQPSPTGHLEAREYRLFCLIALGRHDDARSEIQKLLEANPSYQLSAEQASPRVVAVFKDVRQAALPGIVQRAYEAAKSSFDNKDPKSTAAFERVLTLLGDPDLVSRPAFSDLRIVASGFMDLSRAFADPPRAAPSPTTPAKPSTAAAPAPPRAPVVYGEQDAGVAPATALSQEAPRWTLTEASWPREGVIDLVIDEHGSVVSAVLTQRIHPRYDPLLVKAAMLWRYSPGRKDGKPVPVRKSVRVRVVPN